MSEPGEFLDKADLRGLTGCAWTSTQAEWLRTNGIPFKQDGKRLHGALIYRSSGG